MAIRPLTSDVLGLARFIDREYAAMPAGQVWRELIVNGAESGATRVIIDGWQDPDTGKLLVRVSDDGKGMTDDQLVAHLATLHITTSGKGPDNHGIGARLASLTPNPAGVAYASRTVRDGDGLVRLVRERDKYGIKAWDVGDGELAELVMANRGELDNVTGKHGTAVIQHGDGRHATWTQDTGHAVHKYLAERFYQLPVEVRVQQDLGRRRRNAVVARDAWLEKHAMARDTLRFDVQGASGTIHWSLLPATMGDPAGRDKAPGGVGILNQNEIFEYGSAHVGDFGLTYGSVSRRVVLLVELDGARMDTARGGVVLPGRKSIPWRPIGAHFADHMPPEIERLLAAVTVGAGAFDARLAAMLDEEWFKKLQPVMVAVPGKGDAAAGDDAGLTSGTSEGGGGGGGGGGGKKRKQSTRTQTGDKPATLKPRVVTPAVVFLPPAELVDGHEHITYVAAANEVQVSLEFPPYVREVAQWVKDTGHAESIVRAAVQLAYQVEFGATIVDANAQAKHKIEPALVEELKSDAALYTKALGFQSLSERVRALLKDAAKLAA